MINHSLTTFLPLQKHRFRIRKPFPRRTWLHPQGDTVDDREIIYGDTVDGCEILHQLSQVVNIPLFIGFQHVSTKVMQDFFQVHLVQTFLRSLPGCCHTAHSWPQRVKQLGSKATNNIQKHYKNHRNLQFLMQFPIHHICGHWNF